MNTYTYSQAMSEGSNSRMRSSSRGESGRAPTSHDVARAAQVSQATVSRAFTSPDSVSDEARARVLEAAARLRYAPNAMARSLSSSSSGIVGLVVPNQSDYYEHVTSAFASALAERDLQLLLFEYAIGSDMDRVLSSVRSYQVDALVISALILAPAQAAALAESGVPAVMFNYHGDEDGVSSIAVDAEAGMGQLAELIGRPGASVCYVGGIKQSQADRVRYAAAASRLASQGIPCEYVEAGMFTYESGLEATHAVVAAQPDVVMAASDSIAFGLMDGLRARGFDIPGDVAVTGFDGLPQSRWLSYGLTTIGQPIDQLVSGALELVLAGDSRTEHRLVPGELNIGSSTCERTPVHG